MDFLVACVFPIKGQIFDALSIRILHSIDVTFLPTRSIISMARGNRIDCLGWAGLCFVGIMLARLRMLIPPLPWHRPCHDPGEGDRVILLHGLWRSVWSMEAPARALREAGYEVLNLPYPSFRETMPDIVKRVAESIPPSPKRTHFVTHSMGGIVARLLAREDPGLLTGKVVMMAPPNQGSAIIDWLSDCRPARWALGPGGMSLSSREVQERVPPFSPETEVFAVMGRRRPFPVFSFLLSEQNDGIVSVSEGWLPGLRRFEVMEADHTFIMAHPEVLAFLLECLQAPPLPPGGLPGPSFDGEREPSGPAGGLRPSRAEEDQKLTCLWRKS